MQREIYPSRQSASYERKRAGRACLVCRTRKTKCDNARPVCGFCQASGGECRYPDDDGTDHSKLDRGTLTILQRLGEMESALRDLLIEDKAKSPLLYAPSNVRSTESSHAGNIQTPDWADEYRASLPPSARIIIEGAEIAVESILTWPVFDLNKASIKPAVKLMSEQKTLRPTQGDGLFDLDPETVYYLVNNFLANNHPKNPIFDINILLEQVRTFVQQGVGWNETSCLVLLVCAIGAIAPKWQNETQRGNSRMSDRLNRAEIFFQAAQKRLGMVCHETSLLAIQCTFLTAVYLMSTLRILAAWKAFSQASTQCVGWLASREQPTNGAQLHVEESLYWSCLKSELELRSELRLPGSSLNEMHYPHVYPSPPGFPGNPIQFGTDSPIDATLATRDDPNQTRDDLERGWFFYLAEIALRRIMNDALSTRYGRNSWYFTTTWWVEDEAGTYSRHVDEFEQKLEAWYEMLPPPMAFVRDPTQKLCDPLRGILRGHLVDILDVLYFPAVKAVVCRPFTDLSTTTLEIAAKGLKTCMDRITLCQEGFWHRHQGTWIMIRTCSRSALQLLALATRVRKDSLEGESNDVLKEMLPQKWQEAVASVIELVEYWKDESPDLYILLGQIKHLYGGL